MASLSRKRGRDGNTDTQSGFQQSSETIVNDYKTQIVAANSDIITAMLLFYIIYITQINQNKYFASFWVEGLPVLWLTIIFLLKFIF